MKKIYLLLFFVLLLLPFRPADAKIQIIQPTSSVLPEVDGFVVHFSDPSPVITKAIEVIDTSDPGVKQLGIYPSQQQFYYTLAAEGKWQYKAVGSNDDWAPLGTRISVNKILLRLDSSENEQINPVLSNEDDEEVVLPTYNTRSEKTSSADNKLTVDVPTGQALITKVFAPVKNGALHLVSSFYKIESQLSDYVVEFFYDQQSNFSRAIYSYNQENKLWQKLQSYNDFPNKVIKTEVKAQAGPQVLAIFEDYDSQDGIASFYDQSRYKYFNYKNGNFAASRDFPKGTKLKVTRLLSGESIIVEVNDYGPELSTGRLIDLDISAFKQLGSTSAGLIYVSVEKYDSNF
ncbi:hypothetical protein C4566_00465 [Candidatus Parcubacteria bacterium]|nr:MAG: hypothetical protein C4566_00465 [Candidatus Parcubacteria bacterium]